MRVLRASVIILLFVWMTDSASGQDQAAADTSYAWVKTLIGKASGSQAGFQNWAEGGVNTMALTLGLDGKIERSTRTWMQIHSLKLSFGLVKQDTLDFRKAEDVIRISSSLNYKGDGFFGKFSPTIAFVARTQFARGFNFEKNPFGDGRIPPVQVSDFMSPGTFIQSLGLTYTPTSSFKQRLGFAAKETVVMLERLRPLYGVKQTSAVRFEMGLESFSELDLSVAKNVQYKSTLGLFAAFNNPNKPDMVWENLIAMKVNSWLGVNIEWVLLFDSDVSSTAQFKEVFAVGISYIFI